MESIIQFFNFDSLYFLNIITPIKPNIKKPKIDFKNVVEVKILSELKNEEFPFQKIFHAISSMLSNKNAFVNNTPTIPAKKNMTTFSFLSSTINSPRLYFAKFFLIKTVCNKKLKNTCNTSSSVIK